MDKIEWLSDLCITEISFVKTYIAESKSYPMKNTGRNHHGFLYTISGTETYNFHDKKLRGEVNSVIYIPKGEKYTIDFSRDKSVVIAIDFETAETNNTRPFSINMNRNIDVKSIFAEVEKNWIRKKPYYSAVCKSDFYKITSMLIKQELYYSNSKNYNKISQAVDYLHKNYLDTVAGGLIYRPAHISRKN